MILSMKKINLVSLLILLTACSHVQKVESEKSLTLYEFPLKKYSKLIEGGFSGLTYQGPQELNEGFFWTHTDRGPNAESYTDNKTGLVSRPFLNPNYNPHLTQFKIDRETKTIIYRQELPLKLPDGKLLTGLPNQKARDGRTGDEAPVDTKYKSLKPRDGIRPR